MLNALSVSSSPSAERSVRKIWLASNRPRTLTFQPQPPVNPSSRLRRQPQIVHAVRNDLQRLPRHHRHLRVLHRRQNRVRSRRHIANHKTSVRVHLRAIQHQVEIARLQHDHRRRLRRQIHHRPANAQARTRRQRKVHRKIIPRMQLHRRSLTAIRRPRIVCGLI